MVAMVWKEKTRYRRNAKRCQSLRLMQPPSCSLHDAQKNRVSYAIWCQGCYAAVQLITGGRAETKYDTAAAMRDMVDILCEVKGCKRQEAVASAEIESAKVQIAVAIRASHNARTYVMTGGITARIAKCSCAMNVPTGSFCMAAQLIASHRGR